MVLHVGIENIAHSVPWQYATNSIVITNAAQIFIGVV
jgi:hypothetical protein